ncbi:MAG: hypothetical protein QHH15_04615 [Candidatus Thermoplasmatota archaeon]|jgi:hypothetical protein|nr:hypothetical protein [Candidatus Thermoplasmatota archaeon]
MVKIKSRNDILNDVIKEGKKHPNDWKAVFGQDKVALSRDCYIINPSIGIYLLKEYEKNPFEIKGLGGLIARHVDEDIEAEISKYAGDFGILQGDYKKIFRNLKKGIKPQEIFDAAISGKKDLGISLPVRGLASTSKDVFNNIRDNLLTKQKNIDEKFKKIASDEGLYRSYE